MQQRADRAVHSLRLPVRHQRRATRFRLEELRGDADLVQQPRDVLGGHPFARSRIRAVVRGVDPDQVTAELDHLGVGLIGLGHGAILSFLMRSDRRQILARLRMDPAHPMTSSRRRGLLDMSVRREPVTEERDQSDPAEPPPQSRAGRRRRPST